MTTCKRFTNSLPKLSLIALSPLKRRHTRSAGYTGGPVNTQAVSFSGYTGEGIFQVRHGESLKSLLSWMVGIEPTTPKSNGLSTTLYICLGLSGVLVRLTTCKRLTNSIPTLSLKSLSPPYPAGYQVGRIYGWTCQYPVSYKAIVWVNNWLTFCKWSNGLKPH